MGSLSNQRFPAFHRFTPPGGPKACGHLAAPNLRALDSIATIVRLPASRRLDLRQNRSSAKKKRKRNADPFDAAPSPAISPPSLPRGSRPGTRPVSGSSSAWSNGLSENRRFFGIMQNIKGIDISRINVAGKKNGWFRMVARHFRLHTSEIPILDPRGAPSSSTAMEPAETRTAGESLYRRVTSCGATCPFTRSRKALCRLPDKAKCR